MRLDRGEMVDCQHRILARQQRPGQSSAQQPGQQCRSPRGDDALGGPDRLDMGQHQPGRTHQPARQ